MKVYLILTIILLNINLCSAQPSEENHDFANELFFEGDYVAALNEYKRLYFYSSEDRSKEFFSYRVGICYLGLEEYTQARRYLNTVFASSNDSFLRHKSLEGIIASYNFSDEYSLANSELNEYIARGNLSYVEREYLHGIGYFYQANWQRARTKFGNVLRRISKDEMLGQNQEMITRIKRLYQQSRDAIRTSRRSPTFAALLSVFLPGSGQIYTGKCLNGVSAFFLNGVVAYSVSSLYRNNHHLSAVILLLYGTNLWSTNVRNAYNFAVQYNKENFHKFLMEPFSWDY